jgi:hypothetical protein
MMMQLLRLVGLFRRQDGISLVMAVGVLGVLSLSGATMVEYANSNSRSSEYSKDNSGAYSVAEAGLNDMMSVLSHPSNNALNEHLLPQTTRSYDGGTVTWSGVLNKQSAVWSLTSIGRIKNPSGGTAADVTRVLTAKVPVTATTTQPLNNPSWNYIMSTQTGNLCDMTIGSTVEVRTNLYVFGNLCLQQSAKVLKGETNPTTLVVNGKLDQATQQNTAGMTGAGQGIAEVRIATGCKWFNKPLYDECVTGSETAVYAGNFSTEPATLVGPTANFNAWYLNAAPGPYFPCTTVSGTPPTFDSPVAASGASEADKFLYKNNNLAVQNLTPTGSSYTCSVSGGGELSWNATTKELTVSGTIYIDGDAKIEFAAPTVVQYNGQASMYVSGSFLLKNAKLCGGVQGTNCDFASWNPNTEMLAIVADGDNRQSGVDSGYSISILNSQFQGALYASKKLDVDSFSRVDGPMVGTEVALGQSVSTNDFPNITTVPAGMPGNPTVYAQPNPPQLYSG